MLRVIVSQQFKKLKVKYLLITVAVMNIKDLRPKVFSTHPETDGAKSQWLQWIKSFTTYINKLGEVSAEDKLNRLINHIDATVHELFSEAPDYETLLIS